MVDDLCCKLGISRGIFYNRRSKYAGLEVYEATCLRELEIDNITQSSLEFCAKAMFGIIAFVDAGLALDGYKFQVVRSVNQHHDCLFQHYYRLVNLARCLIQDLTFTKFLVCTAKLDSILESTYYLLPSELTLAITRSIINEVLFC